MATANPLGEDTFDLEINRVRRKIKAKFIDLIDCLKARENELLRQLNSILVSYHLYRSELERFHEKIRDLENKQNALTGIVSTSSAKNMHESMLLQISTEMKSMWTPSLIEPKIVTFECGSYKMITELIKLGKFVEKLIIGTD